MEKNHYFYEAMAQGENLSWCKPIEYAYNDKRAIVVCNEGDVSGGLFWEGENRVLPEACAPLADRIKETDFDEAEELIAGWFGIDRGDLSCRDLGCSQCPWRRECECMELTGEEWFSEEQQEAMENFVEKRGDVTK